MPLSAKLPGDPVFIHASDKPGNAEMVTGEVNGCNVVSTVTSILRLHPRLGQAR